MNEFPVPLRDLLKNGYGVGRNGKRIAIASLSTANNLRVLKRLMMDRKPERTVEIGLALGGSCMAITQAHKDLGRQPQSQHVAIDPFQCGDWMEEAGILAMEKSGLSGYLDFRSAYSCFALPPLALAAPGAFGLAYVDGSHLFEETLVEFFYLARLMAIGGVILFDDSSFPQVQKVIRFIRKNRAYDFRELDLSPYREMHWFDHAKYRVAKAANKVQLTAFEKIGTAERPWTDRFRDF